MRLLGIALVWTVIALAMGAHASPGPDDGMPALGDRVTYRWYEVDAGGNETDVATLEARWLDIGTAPTPDQKLIHALRMEIVTTDLRGAKDRTATAVVDFEPGTLQQLGVTQVLGTADKPRYSQYVAPPWSVHMCGLTGVRQDPSDGSPALPQTTCLVPDDAPGIFTMTSVTWSLVDADEGWTFQTVGAEAVSEMHFHPGIRYPMRLSTDIGDGALRVMELVDHLEGTVAPDVPEAPPADQPPGLVTGDAPAMGPEPTQDTPWPLEEALQLLEEDEDSRRWLEDHPDAWVSLAAYDHALYTTDRTIGAGHEHRHEQNYRTWKVVLTDGKNAWPVILYLHEQCDINDWIVCPATKMYHRGVTAWEDETAYRSALRPGAFRPTAAPTPGSMQAAVEHFTDAEWNAPYRYVSCGASGCNAYHGARSGGWEKHSNGTILDAEASGTMEESYHHGVYWRDGSLWQIVRAHHVEYEESVAGAILGHRVPLPALDPPRVPVPRPPLPRLPDESHAQDDVLVADLFPKVRGGPARTGPEPLQAASSGRMVDAALPAGVVVAAAATGGIALWLLLKAPLLGLFSRFVGSRALEHPLRRRVHAFIEQNPGVHIQELSRRLQVPSSTLRHHLSILQRTGLATIRSTGGVNHCFVGTGVAADAAAKAAALKARSARAVLQATEQQPIATPRQIAKATGLSQRTVYYHLRRLRAVGLVR